VGAVTITSGTITSTGGSGILTGSGALTKSGSANATIVSGATYSGGASITGGKLLVNGSISGSTSVSGSGTLGGTGTLGAVNVLSGGTISPGNGPGILTTGSLSLASGASMSMELNGTTAGTSYDRLITTGTVSLGGASLNLSLGYAPAQGDTFFLIVNGGGTSPGTFAGDGEGATFQLSYNSQNYLFEVTYLANSSGSSFTGGHDVALEVIPEPTTWIMLFGGFCTLVTIHRFRRQRSR
jgi:hypothetical protein